MEAACGHGCCEARLELADAGPSQGPEFQAARREPPGVVGAGNRVFGKVRCSLYSPPTRKVCQSFSELCCLDLGGSCGSTSLRVSCLLSVLRQVL